MIRLEKLYIKGFKDPNREINLTFAAGPITVIYGKNGCGKTTLLNVLSAVFRQDEEVLAKENVKELQIEYIEDGITKYLGVGNRDADSYTFFDDQLEDKSSILFGVHRGLTPPFGNNVLSFEEIDEILDSASKQKSFDDYRVFIQLAFGKAKHDLKKQIENIAEKHIYKDFITIDSIADTIKNSYTKGLFTIHEKTSNAFFETVETIEQQAENEFELNRTIKERVMRRKEFIHNALSKQNSSLLKDKVLKYLETSDSTVLDTRTTRALLINLLEKAEEANPDWEAVQKLQKIFNEHCYKKQLVINNNSIYIGLDGGGQHNLDQLSSGERNLLSVLTLFLIMGKNRDFLMIDEPENSLHLDWQENFLKIINEINPQAQIIVATHSPAIAPDTNSLVELL